MTRMVRALATLTILVLAGSLAEAGRLGKAAQPSPQRPQMQDTDADGRIVTVYSLNPLVLTIDGFLNEAECGYLLHTLANPPDVDVAIKTSSAREESDVFIRGVTTQQSITDSHIVHIQHRLEGVLKNMRQLDIGEELPLDLDTAIPKWQRFLYPGVLTSTAYPEGGHVQLSNDYDGPEPGDDRAAGAVMFLAPDTDVAGGEIVFPYLHWSQRKRMYIHDPKRHRKDVRQLTQCVELEPACEADPERLEALRLAGHLVCCCRRRLKVAPKQGRLLLYFSVPVGPRITKTPRKRHPVASHASCPVGQPLVPGAIEPRTEAPAWSVFRHSPKVELRQWFHQQPSEYTASFAAGIGFDDRVTAWQAHTLDMEFSQESIVSADDLARSLAGDGRVLFGSPKEKAPQPEHVPVPIPEDP